MSAYSSDMHFSLLQIASKSFKHRRNMFFDWFQPKRIAGNFSIWEFLGLKSAPWSSKYFHSQWFRLGFWRKIPQNYHFQSSSVKLSNFRGWFQPKECLNRKVSGDLFGLKWVKEHVSMLFGPFWGDLEWAEMHIWAINWQLERCFFGFILRFCMIFWRLHHFSPA